MTTFLKNDAPMDQPMQAESRKDRALGMLRSMREKENEIQKSLYPNQGMTTVRGGGHDLISQVLENGDLDVIRTTVKYIYREMEQYNWNREYVANRLAVIETKLDALVELTLEANKESGV